MLSLYQIKKSYIDRSLESTTQQNYRIAFRWTGSGNPSPMECPVTIIGTTEPIVVKLILPIHEEGKSGNLIYDKILHYLSSQYYASLD